MRGDYRRRVPFVRHAAVVSFFGLVVPLLLGSVVIGGCGTQHKATGFCATIRRGHAAFDSLDKAHVKKALAEFDRVAKSAPATVAPDLRTVSSTLLVLYNEPGTVAKDPAMLRRYFEATVRVDNYLRQSCGVRVPRRVLF
ncbi:MAG: hypothetical protein QOH10_639 [Actinomycetota bacterium]|nr:hypothetical protein [Actinomycetota bacterium]